MKNSFPIHSFRRGMVAAFVLAAGTILSLQGCLLPPPVVVREQAPPPPPPPLAAPFLFVVPGTYAYYAADVNVDIFFYQGSWYRPYGNQWYLAHDYNGPWNAVVIDRVPPVLRNVPPGYRTIHTPSGRLPYSDVRSNWRTWERERHWDRHDEMRHERYEDEHRGHGRDHRDDRDRDEYREHGRGSDRDERDRDAYRDNRRYPEPQRVQEQVGDDDRGRGRDRGPGAGQVTQPPVQQQEKKEEHQKNKQDNKKDKGRKKDKNDGDDEQGRGNGKNK